jgi:hypothetical protein
MQPSNNFKVILYRLKLFRSGTRSGARLTTSEVDKVITLTDYLLNELTYLETIDMLDYRYTINHKYTMDT